MLVRISVLKAIPIALDYQIDFFVISIESKKLVSKRDQHFRLGLSFSDVKCICLQPMLRLLPVLLLKGIVVAVNLLQLKVLFFVVFLFSLLTRIT